MGCRMAGCPFPDSVVQTGSPIPVSVGRTWCSCGPFPASVLEFQSPGPRQKQHGSIRHRSTLRSRIPVQTIRSQEMSEQSKRRRSAKCVVQPITPGFRSASARQSQFQLASRGRTFRAWAGPECASAVPWRHPWSQRP